MKKYLTMALAGVVMLGAGVVSADICAFDNAPAASLLFPYVAYNYDAGAEGVNTFFSVTNTSNEATIAHVTLWTDFSVPILDFNVLLSGYDVQVMDIRSILRDGALPVTTIAAQTPTQGITDDGPISFANDFAVTIPINPADPQPTAALSPSRCSTGDPAYPGLYVTPIPTNILQQFQGWLQQSQTTDRYFANCQGDTNDSLGTWWLERGTDANTGMYITVDVVDTCNTLFPDNFAYWVSEARFDNVLIGDVLWVDDQNRFSEGMNAVHLEADFLTPAVIGPFGFPVSFYHRYANLGLVSDYREPLPTAWAFRYMAGGDLSTSLRVWKGSALNVIVPDLVLDPQGLTPNEMWARFCIPYTYYAWDENENVSTTDLPPWSWPGEQRVVLNLLPLETQEVDVAEFNITADFGWMLFVWPASNWTGDIDDPLFDFYQTWMGVKIAKEGDYSAFVEGAVMANWNCYPWQDLPTLGWNDSFGLPGGGGDPF